MADETIQSDPEGVVKLFGVGDKVLTPSGPGTVSDIALMADDLLRVPEAIRLSKATLRNIRQNVVIALVTVAALLAGVLLGEIHMASGMLIHEASVLVVTVNGMRLLRI